MKKQWAFSLFFAVFLVFAGAVIAGSGKTADVAMAPAIGATIDDFTLPDADGKDHSLSSLRGKNGTVVIFISVNCPISNAYNERMAKLAEEYGARGINVVGINSNKSETADAVKTHAADKHLNFTILKDPGNKIAVSLARSTHRKPITSTRITSCNITAASITARTLPKSRPMTCATLWIRRWPESPFKRRHRWLSAARLSGFDHDCVNLVSWLSLSPTCFRARPRHSLRRCRRCQANGTPDGSEYKCVRGPEEIARASIASD